MKFSLPEIIVFVVAAALPTYLIRFNLGAFPTTLLEIALIAAIVVLVAQTIKTKQISTNFTRLKNFATTNKLLSIGVALILIATIIGIIVSPDKRGALGIAKAYFWEPILLTILLIGSNPDREKIQRAALAGFGVSAFVVIIYGLLQYTHPQLIPSTWTAERRITSVFDFPNAAALYLAPLITLFLSSPVTIALGAFSILIIVLAKSAGGMAASAVAIFLLGVWKKKTRKTMIALAILATLAIIFLPSAADFRDQILMRDWSGRVHKIGWEESFNMLKEHPVFGAGLNGYKTVVAPYHTAKGVEIFQYPHNLFLATWSELGILGLIGFAFVLIWFFRRIYVLRSKFYVLTLAAALVAILAHGLVDVPYFKNDLSMMFWLFITIAAI